MPRPAINRHGLAIVSGREVNRSLRLVAFAVGAGLLVALIIYSGPALLWHALRRSLWVVGPLMVIWGVVYACSARAWQLLIPDRPPAFTFVRAFLLTISGSALNFTTPAFSFGGEPFKMAGAAPILGGQRALGSVASFRLLQGLAHLIVLLLAMIPAAIVLPHTPLVFALLGTSTVVIAGAALFLFSSHRAGIFERGVTLVHRLLPFPALGRALEKHRTRLQELDVEMSAVHGSPGQFALALAMESAGRIAGTLEYAVILYGVGLGGNLLRAFVVANLTSVVTLVLFFVPFELGAKEGGIALVLAAIGLDPKLGTSVALLSRVRELGWAAIGIAASLAVGPVEAPQAASPER